MISLFLTLFTLAADSGPVQPAESVSRIHVPPDVRVELIAAEPDIVDPVAVAFDERGRMFVVENRGYPEDESGAGQIALLMDEDGDGAYSRVSTFYNRLNFPNGVMAWNGGIIVTDAPQVLFLNDTTGDGVADVREVLLDGFSLGGSTQLRVSHPTLGLDNWIHFSNGLSGGEIQIPPNSDPLKMGLYDLRYNPFSGELETVGGRAQFGLTFDDFGHKFVCSNRNHIQHVVMSPHDLARNSAMTFSKTVRDVPDHGAASDVFPLTGAPTTAYAHAGTFTAACGLVIYRGTALPTKYQGNAFVCEPTGNLVHRDMLTPSGATFTAKRGRDGIEFLASEDDWFRPVYLTNGPGGALYLCDMYRGTIEHPTYLPGEVAAITDFSLGRERGRIYRITGESRELDSIAATIDTDALINDLSNDDAWHRETAHRIILESRNTASAPMLRNLLESDSPTKARVHALSLLNGLDSLKESDLIVAMTDSDSALREQGTRLARLSPKPTDDLAAALQALSADTDAHVRFEAALAIGDSPSPDAVDHLVDILVAAPNDEWTRAAVLSGVHDSLDHFAERYLDTIPVSDSDHGTARAIGSMIARAQAVEKVADFTSRALALGDTVAPRWRMDLLNGVFLGARRSGKTVASSTDQLRSSQSPETQQQLDALVTEALTRTMDLNQLNDNRLAAIEFLGSAPFDTASPALTKLLTPSTPAALQVQAIRSLFQSRHERAAPYVLADANWNAFTGQARDAALTGLLSAPASASHLIAALESGTVPAWSIPAQYRSRLLRHADAELQTRAKAIFSEVPQEDRMKVYEVYREVLKLAGDSKAGRSVFENTCASCHRFGDMGHEVGPDLTGIGSQSSDSILLHVLVPNWLKLPGYESYQVETDALEEFVGIIVAESEANITLRAAYGVENTIPRESITAMRLMALSMMPGELEQTMTRQELRDLIAFLKREPAV